MEPMVDASGNKHYITERIASDGQGVLYATKNTDIIVRDAQGRKGDLKRYNYARILPLSDIENLLLPIDYLEAPHVGYVINIPKGYVPLTTMMNAGNDKAEDFYLKTGGFKRRLSILAEIAKVLIRLHALPLMYGSMAPGRIFISSRASDMGARLLYSVKMDFSMGFLEEMDADPYIAPEAQRGQGSTIASDSYSFGALVYDLLTMQGTQNVLPAEIKELLDKSQAEPPDRPKIIDFYRLFLQQLDFLLSCKSCLADYYYDNAACPKCGSPPPKTLKATIYDQVEENTIDRGVKILELGANRQCFWNYQTDNVLLDDALEPRIDCVLNVSGDRKLHLTFRNLMDKDININDKTVAAGQGTVVALPCELISIKFNLYAATQRCIDMVMVWQ